MTIDDVYRIWPSDKAFERETEYSSAARRLWRKKGKIPIRTQLVLTTLAEGKLKMEGDQ